MPWPTLRAAQAPPLGRHELRIYWCPETVSPLPRRARLDALLRGALAPLLGLPPEQLRLGREPRGRPFLQHADAPDFNLSDTAGGTVLAITRAARVGVDLERLDRQPPVARLAPRWFAAAEAAALAALPAATASAAFLRLWTAKEASCKATGTGIFGFLKTWQFAVAPEQPQLLALPDGAGAALRWRHERLQPSSAHTAVLALRDADPSLELRGYQLD